MDDRLKDRIAKVTAGKLFGGAVSDFRELELPAQKVLADAHRGLNDPAGLTPTQIRGISYALIIVYAQMGVAAG